MTKRLVVAALVIGIAHQARADELDQPTVLAIAALRKWERAVARFTCIESIEKTDRRVTSVERRTWSVHGNTVVGAWKCLGDPATEPQRVTIAKDGWMFIASMRAREWHATTMRQDDAGLDVHGVLRTYMFPLMRQRATDILLTHGSIESAADRDTITLVTTNNDLVGRTLRDGLRVIGFVGWRLSFRRLLGEYRLVEVAQLRTVEPLPGAASLELLPDTATESVKGVACGVTHLMRWSAFRDLGGAVWPTEYQGTYAGVVVASRVDWTTVKQEPEETNGFEFVVPASWGGAGQHFDLRRGDVLVYGVSQVDAVRDMMGRGEQMARRSNMWLWVMPALIACAGWLVLRHVRRRG